MAYWFPAKRYGWGWGWPGFYGYGWPYYGGYGSGYCSPYVWTAWCSGYGGW